MSPLLWAVLLLVSIALCTSLQTGAHLRVPIATAATMNPEQLAHWVIVTDCSAYMFNQGNLMLASAHHVKQPGNFTWIVYGCQKPTQFAAFKRIAHPTANVWHQGETDLINPTTGKLYPAFQASNRPVAVLAWFRAVHPMEESIAIIDPDMTWLRPVHLVAQPRADSVSQLAHSQFAANFEVQQASDLAPAAWESLATAPKQGSGARYGQGCIPHQFTDEQMTKICGDEDGNKCAAARADFDTCADSYSSGPPWILHTSDAEDVLGAWTDVAVKVHEVYPEMLAEQVSYGVTQMKFDVRSTLDAFWFLSAPNADEQPWASVASLDWDPCQSRAAPPAAVGVPPLWHACSTFALHGDAQSPYRLHKDHIHKDLLDCDAPLLRYAPLDSLQRYKASIGGGFIDTKEFRDTWSLCTYTNTVNFYAGMWKRQFCTKPNLDPSFAYPNVSAGFVNNNTWLETVFRLGGWSDVDYNVGVGSDQPSDTRSAQPSDTSRLPEDINVQKSDSSGKLTVTPEDLRDLFRLQGANGKCLNFLHIPKTAGSSIEEDSKTQASWENNSGVRGWGINDNTLRCSHPVGLQSKLPWGGDGHRCQVPKLGNGHQNCDLRHVPPSLDAKVMSTYAECDTFCVVRNPFERMISQARYDSIPCNKNAIEEFVSEFVIAQDKYPGSGPGSGWKSHIGCHGLHQTEYVYGGMFDYSRKGRYCQHVLKYENLEEEFAELMDNFSILVVLQSHKKDLHCDVALSNETKQIIREYYAKDFENFGF